MTSAMKTIVSFLFLLLPAYTACFSYNSFNGPSVSVQRKFQCSRPIFSRMPHNSRWISPSSTRWLASPDETNETPIQNNADWVCVGLFASVGFFYWYWMVLGAAAQTNGLPVPDFIPMTPGWPATDQDFAPVLEDSYHFFYLSELIQNKDAPHVIPPRLGIFNFVEAWVFAFLPALWKDPRRLSRPVLLGSWLLLGINLTNAFLAPYLLLTEIRTPAEETFSKNRMVSGVFGGIASAVVGYAVLQCSTVATGADWAEFWDLVKMDRSYLAFCVDPVVLAIFQPLILARANHGSSKPLDYVPFVGLIAWLFQSDEEYTC
jgi:hypothetical protein